jgi:hypothetical protein
VEDFKDVATVQLCITFFIQKKIDRKATSYPHFLFEPPVMFYAISIFPAEPAGIVPAI